MSEISLSNRTSLKDIMFTIFLPESEESGKAEQRRDVLALQLDAHSQGVWNH